GRARTITRPPRIATHGIVGEKRTMPPGTPQESLREVVVGFRAWVEEARDSFVDGFPRASAPTAEVPVTNAVEPPPAANVAIATETGTSLGGIREEIGDCRRCKLCEKRTQIVFGVGNPTAELMFVGEGPGEEEDRRGEPFVGRAGQLLTDIITRGM